jgi:hypothetical protein
MKKINKKNLQQLSETVAVLTESEQKRFIGAAFYYSYEGNLLGFMGDSCEVRVVDAGTFYSLQYCNDDTCLFGSSNSLFYSDEQTQANVINYMAMELGLSNIYVGALYDKVGNLLYTSGGRTTHFGTSYTYPDGSVIYDHQYSYITINNVSDMFKNGNFYDIMCTLIHEQDHYENYNFYTHENVASEYYAYNVTIYNEYFEYASSEFQESIYSQYRYYQNLFYNMYY